MGCAGSSFEEKNNEQNYQVNKEETKEIKHIENTNENTKEKLQTNNQINSIEKKQIITEETKRENTQEKLQEKENEEYESMKGLHDEHFIKCKELDKKSFNENTIIYYKNVIYLNEKKISHYENIVIKTLKQEGLPYKTKFQFKSPSVLISNQSKLRMSVSKKKIVKGKSFECNYTECEFKITRDSGNLIVDITIEQNPDEPFVAYNINTNFDIYFLTGTNNIINMIPFNKINLGNPNCMFEIYYKNGKYKLYSTDRIPNNELIQKDKYLKYSGDKDDNIILLFKTKDIEFTISPTDSAFQSQFYSPDMINIIQEALKKITLGFRDKAIIWKETYIIKEKKVTVEVVKTFGRLKEYPAITANSTIHFFREYNKIKLISVESSNNPKNENLNSIEENSFRMSYIMKRNEIFVTVKAVYEFEISKIGVSRDVIEIGSNELAENGLYYCSIKYDKNEYGAVSLMRDPNQTFINDNYYMEYFSNDYIKNGLNDIFNKIYLIKFPKESIE